MAIWTVSSSQELGLPRSKFVPRPLDITWLCPRAVSCGSYPGLRSSAITPPLLPSPSHWRSLRTRGNNFSLFHSNKMILVFGWKIDIGLTWSATITGSYLKSLLMRIIRSRAFYSGSPGQGPFFSQIPWVAPICNHSTHSVAICNVT